MHAAVHVIIEYCTTKRRVEKKHSVAAVSSVKDLVTTVISKDIKGAGIEGKDVDILHGEKCIEDRTARVAEFLLDEPFLIRRFH